ncbi:putative leucine-rich repeat receptor-like serine/threonine-protein kinase At2g24130 isoform X2 [Cryptomeria japonica]|uniref:putative leucine-rich repeat receptor-like serine/threonine-protein kinase At2g24130 isoform X2 n=1 Tax=Cryptomeria japonica TaxID=3369 RepID=UPI0027DA7636|nr:putative leucine-rich repeat receptor-like serine/threonine-protein kinase At2g24130 isoform X2 [Cryptomeria japonica]
MVKYLLNLVCTQLRVLYLPTNNLTGVIPTALSNCTLLQNLSLSSNQLTGHIPNELGMLNQLTVLSLGNNTLTGVIPKKLGMLNQIRVLQLDHNNLTGVIPDSISNCTLIQVLQLCANQLTGRIPSELGKLFQLEYLFLWDNHLVSGSRGLSFLTALSNCSSLKYLQLSQNYLTGTLPSSISHLSSRLFDWRLASNKIEGNIPSGVRNLTNLVTLDLSDNHFNGSIPTALSQLPNLQMLFLDKNNLNGRIPESFGHAKPLGLLSLSENMISGEIPKRLGDLPQLRDLVLHHNQLSGKLPSSLGRCITLEKVDLAHNKLEGNIPLEWAALENLQFYFNISSNLLQGSISVMSKMVMVQAIDVSVNNFSGKIPDVLSSCTNLQYLNLSWNSFDDLIPTSLTSLKNLEAIDLSSNNLSGTILMAFQEMKMLQYINLSSNNLIGEVPKRGVFSRIDKSAVSGNVGLCGDWIKLQPCFDSKHKQFLFSKNVIILVVISIAIFIMSSAVFLFFYRRNTNQNIPNLNFGPERISYEELVDATSGFSQTNLLGVGSFGSVYRGILKNGTNIAVKVLNLQDENAIQSFERECNVLKRVRHRNVIKIISACSNLDFRALVLPFMSNGSLERWLYPQGGDECRLNLADRLRIAKEVAQGMEYLHHYCFVQVIHCDLKPNNVLLGNDMTPHIADFSITKLLFENSLTSTTTLKGSIGYFAPEYGVGGNISTKGDVYSYGILLLELLTRKRPTDTMFVEGLVCTRELPQQRPNMMEIVERLEKITSAFLGTPRDFHLPINILPLLESTNEPRNCNSRSPKNWSTSTS